MFTMDFNKNSISQNQLPNFISVPPSPMSQLQQNTEEEKLQQFWQKQLHNINAIGELKSQQQLSLAGIRRMMKSEGQMISAETPLLMGKACEFFIQELAYRAWMHAEEANKRTLQPHDVSKTIMRTDVFEFLTDVLPNELIHYCAYDGKQEEDVGNIVEGEHVMPHVDASFMEDLMMNIGLVSSGNCAEENQNALPHAASFMGNHMMNMSNVSTKNFAEGVIPHVVGLMRNPMNMGNDLVAGNQQFSHPSMMQSQLMPSDQLPYNCYPNDMMARSSQFPPPSMIQPSFVPLDQPPYKTDIDMVVSNQQSVQPSMMQPPFMSLDQLPYNCHPK